MDRIQGLPPLDLDWLHSALSENAYFRTPALPDAWLFVHADSFDNFLSSLPKNSRHTARRNLGKFNRHQGATIEIRDRFDDLIPAMMPLYQAVLDRAETRLDAWTPQFITSLSNDPGIPAKAVICRQDGRLAGFLLCLFGQKVAIALRIGLDYNISRQMQLYQVAHYRGIEEAIRTGVTRINFTQTSYEAKRKMGCHLVSLEHAVTHRNRTYRLLLRHFLPLALNRAGQ